VADAHQVDGWWGSSMRFHALRQRPAIHANGCAQRLIFYHQIDRIWIAILLCGWAILPSGEGQIS